MKALLFPGQGSQKAGMAAEFEKNFKIVKEIFKRADETLNIKLSELILNGPEENLKKTEITQPAILTTSYAIFEVIKKEINIDQKNFKFFAGHSLGEYSALVSSGSLKFEDALKLVHQRGKFMQSAVPEGEGAMLAVMGVDINSLTKFLEELKNKNGICEIANDNSNGQIILSGDKKSIQDINAILTNNKKRSIFLPVSAPFHCSLMKPASEKMSSLINETDMKDSVFELVNNVTAEPVKSSNEIKNLLIKQIFSKVRWRESVEYMINKDITDFIEVGPGKVLTGLVKRISDKVSCTSINTIEDIKKIK